LTYGNSYDFRVRLMDHTGGGPLSTGSPIVPGPSPIATIPFRRWIRPKAPSLVANPNAQSPPLFIQVNRPLLSYPAVVCTGGYPNVIGMLLSDLPDAKAAGRLPGLPDPDVVKLLITVEVQGLVQDPITTDGQYMPVLKTFRDFPSEPSQPATIDISWVDIADVTTLSALASGALVLPTARNVRVLFAAVCRDDPQLEYFGAEDVLTGPTTSALLRKESADETDLFQANLPSNRIKALFLQPQPAASATVLASQRLAGNVNQLPSDNPTAAASALGLSNDSLTFRSKPGERVVFGCAASIRHVIGPDNASIRLATSDELALQWIVVIQLVVQRDWSWDGFQDGIVVTRSTVEVGRFTQNRSIGSDALVHPQRTQTRFIFFDSIEPKPTGSFPVELNPQYTITCSFTGSPKVDPSMDLTLTLPVTTPPAQVPKVLSAGIAMSPYQRDNAGYTFTDQRAKALWIEFDTPPADPNDSYFCRVLRNAPDPLISGSGFNLLETPDPPLAIDPEQIRIITFGQSDDSAGLDAMQLLTPCDPTPANPQPLRYQLPLPPGLTSSSPELFGFFVYELRIGHRATSSSPSGIWSTAQGRFGRPLQLNGAQHPPPPLVLDVLRTSAGISVSAPFANSVFNGVSMTQGLPRSSMWVLLYAQAEQLDGQDVRNILLGRRKANANAKDDRAVPAVKFGTAMFAAADVAAALAALGFNSSASLSVLATELLPQVNPVADPLGANLAEQRILRTSVLTPVPHICG
jgi:hypothetical protein